MAYQKDQPSVIKGTTKLFNNDYKSNETQPDLRGNVLIPIELINIAYEDEDSIHEYNGVKYLKLKLSVWRNKDDDEETLIANREPLMNGQITQFVKQQAVPSRKPGAKKRLT